MAAEHTDDLIDYEEEDDAVQDQIVAASGASANGAGAEDDKKDKKGSYVGIHSTGFRDFLLKPELLRAIVDCGFEHPSEGLYKIIIRFWMFFVLIYFVFIFIFYILTYSSNLILYSSTRMHPPVHSRYGRSVPG